MSITTEHVTSVDPATGEELARYPLHDGDALDAALTRAHAAQRVWRTASFERRGEVLRAIARELRAEQERAALLITAEMGKTLREARAEVEKSAWVCEYYAEEGAKGRGGRRPRGRGRSDRAPDHRWPAARRSSSPPT